MGCSLVCLRVLFLPFVPRLIFIYRYINITLPRLIYIYNTLTFTLTVIYLSCRSPDAHMAEGETAMEVDNGGEDKAGRFVVKKW